MSESSPPFRCAQANLSAPWTPHASAWIEIFLEKKIKKNKIPKKFQFHQGFSIAVVDDGYVATSVRLKYFKEKKKKSIFFSSSAVPGQRT
jgi:hypothetical protein